jgi:uncharacterized protein
MNNLNDLMQSPVALLDMDSRSRFIMRTYLHLLVAMIGFTLIELFLFASGLAITLAQAMFGTSWLIVLGAFIVVGWLASRAAHQSTSLPVQYLALAGFVVAEAIVFVPLLFLAEFSAPGVIQSAALVTLLGFAGLTAVVFITRRDFSFLRSVLMWGGISALLLIVAGVIFGFELGVFFSVGMIVLAGGSILHDTSKVLHHYPEDRYVAAALELFASVALLFWYVLRLLMALNRR